jgi:peptidoglycan/LPS O-acetylase OafA/YrhL
MADPVVEVAGFTHTTTLGLIEIGIGACLLLSGVARSRSAALFFGAALGIGGFVGAVQTESFDQNLALESSMAWIAVIVGAVVVLATLLVPRVTTHSETIETV